MEVVEVVELDRIERILLEITVSLYSSNSSCQISPDLIWPEAKIWPNLATNLAESGPRIGQI
jgi:hypothetical protein